MAIGETNKNLGRTLELIKLLALIENDLYKHIDDQVVSNNELKSILLDWFKGQGITDDEIRELLETSFQRAYTLRDRLNKLRLEYKESITQCENRISEFEKRHSSLDKELDVLKRNIFEKLNDAFTEKEKILVELHNERTTKLNCLISDNEKHLNEITERFDKKVAEGDEKIKAIKLEKQVILNLITKEKSDFDTEVRKNINELNLFSDKLKEDFLEQIKEQQTQYEEEKSKMISDFKNKMLLSIVGSIVTSSILSYIIVSFL